MSYIGGDFFLNMMDLQHPNHAFLMTKFANMTIIYCTCHFKTEFFVFGFGTSIPVKNCVCVCVCVCVLLLLLLECGIQIEMQVSLWQKCQLCFL